MPADPQTLANVKCDDEGFLKDASDWSEDLAMQMAKNFGIEDLSEEHWKILRYIREHYLAHGTLPVMEHVARVNGLPEEAWMTLFPDGPLQAWKLAGLPDPGMEAKTYMENEVERPHR